MESIIVTLQKPYEVRIEEGILNYLGAHLLRTFLVRCKVALIADDTVNALYGDQVEASLTEEGFEVFRFCFPHGEGRKQLRTWQRIITFLADNRLTRSDMVMALGGGVTGDMAGFAASTYLRGMRFVQLPTTLLAMVDSSVGGKVGVNVPQGKNLVGAFYQPSAVFCDPDTLTTLPNKFLRDGLAEVVKMSVLGDFNLFELIRSGEWEKRRVHVIERCIRGKTHLVEEDEFDKGSRQLLNLGHTFGHAIEQCSGYRFTHGRAVAVGLVYASRLAVALKRCEPQTLRVIQACLRKNGLPITSEYTQEQLLEAILMDKKRAGETLTFVLPRKIGACELYPVAITQLPDLLRLALNEANGE